MKLYNGIGSGKTAGQPLDTALANPNARFARGAARARAAATA